MVSNPFIYSEDGAKIVNSIKEIDDKLSEEKDGQKRTKLMMEQMLRGLQLQSIGIPNI